MTHPAWPDHPRIHAFDDELARLDAVGTAEAIDAGELTAREVLEHTVARARDLDPQLHAVAADRYDAALAEPLPLRTRPGSLQALPTFIKDMVPVAGLPVTWGSVALEGGPPVKKTKGVAVDLDRIGMITLGHSTMPEFGFTSSTEFPHIEPTRNPWNPERSVGGSSGGAASLVAAGVVPMAHAADGGGSIRIPAACAGLVGHKPTRARLRPHAEEERMPVAVSVDGVVTRSVRDTARFYAEMERVRPNRKLPQIGEVTDPPSRRLRIGAIGDTPYPVDIDAPTRATFETTASLLTELGHEVEEAHAPFTVQDRDDFIFYFQFLAFLATRTARLTHGRHVTPADYTDYTRGMAAAFRKNPTRIVGVSRRLRTARARLHTVHEQYDVLLTPTLSTMPPPLGHLGPDVPFQEMLDRLAPWIAFTPIANVTGNPAITLPLGFDPATNMPVGSMFWADHGHDAVLLQLAYELEAARPWPGCAT
jgi:amidase